MGTIHETGTPLRAEPPARAARPAGVRGAPMAFHESQSLVVRDADRRSRGFAGIPPRTVEARRPAGSFELDKFTACSTRVEPGLIRVDADELPPAWRTPSCAMRSSAPLIEGEAEPDDIPALWDEKMMTLFGRDTRGDFATARRGRTCILVGWRVWLLLALSTLARCGRRAVVCRIRHQAHRRLYRRRRPRAGLRLAGVRTTSGSRRAARRPRNLRRARERRAPQSGTLRAHLERRYLSRAGRPTAVV